MNVVDPIWRKEVIHMKKLITFVGALTLVFAVVTALADEMPVLSTESKDAGTMLYLEEAPGHSHPKRFSRDLFYEPGDVIRPTARKDFSGPPVPETLVDAGTVLYISAFETTLTEPGISGSAAGGVSREDETTRIWDNLMGPPGGSDLP